MATGIQQVTRGEKIVQKLVDNKVITPEGATWLILSADPMHDNQLRLAGWPDLSDSASIVRVLKKTHTFAKPVGSSGNWDLVIQTFPILSKLTVNKTKYVNNIMLGADTNLGIPLGAVVALSAPAAIGDFSLATGTVFGPGVEKYVVDLPPEIASGNGRLISMGIEAINTTSTLHVQGTVHSYRVPQEQGTYAGYGYQQNRPAGSGTTTATTPFSGRQVQWVPSSEDVVTLLPGTRTWQAKEGCYTVVPFVSVVNPVQPLEYVQPILVDEFERSDLSTIVSNDNIGTTYPLASDGALGVYYPVKWAPVHSTGMWFTGLSEETTITLTTNMYYEYFPNSKDVALVTMATPSAAYDPAALQMYSAIMGSLPIGVPAKDNGIGAWFADVVSKFGGMVGSALVPIFGPAAAGAGMAAQGMANSYLSSNSPQTKPRLRAYTPQQVAQMKQKAQPRREVVSKPKGPPPLPSRSQFAEKKLTKAQRRKLREMGLI